jgi:hypothetical protein
MFGRSAYRSKLHVLAAWVLFGVSMVWIGNSPFVGNNPWPTVGLLAYIAVCAWLDRRFLRIPTSAEVQPQDVWSAPPPPAR